MSKFDKLLQKIISGTSDKNIHFYDLIKVLNSLEFSERFKGSHHIFYKPETEEIINIQPVGLLPILRGCMADGKSYQEAVQNAEIIISEWIETAVEEGRTITICGRNEVDGKHLFK